MECVLVNAEMVLFGDGDSRPTFRQVRETLFEGREGESRS